MEDLEIKPPNARGPCKHGTWVNVADTPEEMPEMEFKCWITGYMGKLKKKEEYMCDKCILFQPEEKK